MRELTLNDERVKAAMRLVDRREFLHVDRRSVASIDEPIVIGFEQTTSQPSLIAFMLQELHLQPGMKVLEVGTGCGYQTALLSQLGVKVFSIEIIEPLAREAAKTLQRLEVPNVQLRIGDGAGGWPEAAPFDAVIVAAGAPKIPAALIDQLAPHGRLLMPVGSTHDMQLVLATHERTEELFPVRFVPLTGAQSL